MLHPVIVKATVVMAATAAMACVLSIDGRLPWKQHDWSMHTYGVKMALLTAVFTTSAMFVPVRSCKDPGATIRDPFIEKTLVVLLLTTAMSWLLMIDGRIPWEADNWSLFTYCLKLSIPLLSVFPSYALSVDLSREANTPLDPLIWKIMFVSMAGTTMAWILRIDGGLPWVEDERSFSVYCCKMGLLMMVSTMTAMKFSLRRDYRISDRVVPSHLSAFCNQLN